MQFPAEQLAQLSRDKPGSDLNKVAAFTMQQGVLGSGSAEEKVKALPLGWYSATVTGQKGSSPKAQP